MAPVGHDHAHNELDRRLLWSVLLNVGIVVAELVGGWVSGSLSLLSDALHNLSDVAALATALVARRLARRPPSAKHTFGLRRLEVLAALVNSATLLVVVTLIVREAIDRLREPVAVEQSVMLSVAIVGLVGNLAAVLLLHRHVHKHDVNARAAFVHLVQDTLSSVVVVVVALLANWRYGAYLDPIASILVALIVLRAGWSLLVDALHILMEGTPRDIDLAQLRSACEREFGLSMHHVHVWETGGGERMLTAHVRMCEQPLSAVEATVERLRGMLATTWNIQHSTIEPEVVGCGSDGLVDVHAQHHTPATDHRHESPH